MRTSHASVGRFLIAFMFAVAGASASGFVLAGLQGTVQGAEGGEQAEGLAEEVSDVVEPHLKQSVREMFDLLLEYHNPNVGQEPMSGANETEICMVSRDIEIRYWRLKRRYGDEAAEDVQPIVLNLFRYALEDKLAWIPQRDLDRNNTLMKAYHSIARRYQRLKTNTPSCDTGAGTPSPRQESDSFSSPT